MFNEDLLETFFWMKLALHYNATSEMCEPIVAREGHLDMTLSISLGSEVTQTSEFFNR